MNKNILLSAVLCGFCLAPFATVQANDKVETTYNAQKYMQLCKGKSQGTWVSFAYRGIIWNGTCEPQFFSTNKAVKGNESELMTACQTDMTTKSVMINGMEVKGKCALGFTAPYPK